MEHRRIEYHPGIFDPYKHDMNMEHWIEVFPDTKWRIPFAELMWGLGFEMDCYQSFLASNPKFISKTLSDEYVMNDIINVLENSDKHIVGNFLFSFFRQRTHGDYTTELSEKEVSFVEHLFEILDSNLINQ